MIESYKIFKIAGKVEILTIAQAMAIGTPEAIAQVEKLKLDYNNRKMKRDGFEPGYQENIREHCPDRGAYNKRLKELGLVELGRDTDGIKDETKTGGYCNTAEFAQKAVEIGVDLSDNEINAIESGEYFGPGRCDNALSEKID